MNKKILGLFLITTVMPVGAATYDLTEQNESALFDYSALGPRVQTAQSEVKTLINKAEQYFKAGQLDEAEKNLLQSQQLIRGNVKQESAVMQLLGRVYAKQSKAEKLLPLAEDMVKRYPDNTLAQSTLAGALVVNQQKDKAEQVLKQIIAKDSNDINHRLFLAGVLAQSQGREKEVLDLLNQVLQIQPNHPRTLILKTNLYIQQKQSQDALQTIAQIEKSYPGKAMTQKLRGDVKLSEQDVAGAIDFYKQAYQIEPNNKILFLFTDLMKTQNQGEAAIEFLKSESQKNPKNLGIQFKLASIYHQQKEYSKAEPYYQAVLKEQNDNPLVLNDLAWNLYQQNNPKALTYAQKAFELAPKAPAIMDTYGMILLNQGENKKGLELIEKAAKAAPKSLDIQYHLAEANAKNNKQTEAIERLQNLLQSTNYFSERKQAEALLKSLQK